MQTAIRFYLLLIKLLGLVLIGVSPLQANETNANIVRMSGRYFDLGVDVFTLRRGWNFIPMDAIPWLDPILDADPVLHNTVFHIKSRDAQSERAMVNGFMVENAPAYDLWTPPGPGNLYKFSTGIPVRFQIPGYKTWSTEPTNPSHVMLVPEEKAAAFSAVCDTGRRGTSRMLLCVVYASYPPDPYVFLMARLYFPEPFHETWPRFAPIAERMREIAYCLDVTDEVLAGTWHPSPPPENTRLEGCRVEVIS